MSVFTPKALEADCTTQPSVLAMRGFRFIDGPDGAKPKPKPKEEPKPDDDEEEELDLARAKAKIAKANREAAALRKERDDLAAKAKDAEDAKKDDLTKAQEANAELQSKLDAALGRVDRLEIAIEKKLTVKQANRLSGTSRDELEADADDFLADLGGDKADDKKTPPSRQPRESLRGGGDPTEDTDPIDPKKIADEIYD
jgi:hypothetical protein